MVEIVPDIIYVSEAGMERLTGEALISGIGVDIEDINDLERVDSELQGNQPNLNYSRVGLQKYS